MYKDVFEGNRHHENFQPVEHFGDEAFYQTDKTNFHLIMLRKQDKIVCLKVNKVTSFTNEAALKTIVKK